MNPVHRRAIVALVFMIGLWILLNTTGLLHTFNHHLGRHPAALGLGVLLILVWGLHRLLRQSQKSQN
jgi:hypothetical protein